MASDPTGVCASLAFVALRSVSAVALLAFCAIWTVALTGGRGRRCHLPTLGSHFPGCRRGEEPFAVLEEPVPSGQTQNDDEGKDALHFCSVSSEQVNMS